MSQITLNDVKATLRVTHDEDDALLLRLIDSAEQECLRFLGRAELPTLPLEYVGSSSSEEIPSSEDPVAPDVYNGVILMIQADYENDPEKRELLRRAAESLWMPYRSAIGV